MLRVNAVAGEAVVREDRADVAIEIELARGVSIQRGQPKAKENKVLEASHVYRAIRGAARLLAPGRGSPRCT